MADRRWELSRDERARLVEAESEPFSVRDVASALGSAGILRGLARSVLRGARDGIRQDPEFLWARYFQRARRIAPDVAIGAPWHGAEGFLEALLARVDETTHALELGCGAGRISRLVAPHVARLLCTDVSQLMLDEARHALEDRPNVDLRRVEGYTLAGLPTDGFDVVYSHDVLAILDANPALALLDEVSRVLRPGGTCVVSTYTIDDDASKAQQLAIVRQAAREGQFGLVRIRPWTGEFLEALLAAVGLETVERRYDRPPEGADPIDPDHRPHCVVVAVKPGRA